jgi:hypothetical protein
MSDGRGEYFTHEAELTQRIGKNYSERYAISKGHTSRWFRLADMPSAEQVEGGL